MYRNVDMSGVYVLVGVDKVVSEDGSKELRRSDWILFGKNVDSLLLGVRSYNRSVVCLCVSVPSSVIYYALDRLNLRGLDVSLQERTDCHFSDVLHTIGFPLDFA